MPKRKPFSPAVVASSALEGAGLLRGLAAALARRGARPRGGGSALSRRLALGALACGVAACAPAAHPRPPAPALGVPRPAPPGVPACDDAFARELFREHGV